MAPSIATSGTLSSRTVTPGRPNRVPGQGIGPRPALTGAAVGRAISSAPLGLGRGRNGSTRRFKVMRDNIKFALSQPAIRRLARQGGVHRIQFQVYDETRKALTCYLRKLMVDIVAITTHCKRTTIMVGDVCYALKRQGTPIWGFEHMDKNRRGD